MSAIRMFWFRIVFVLSLNLGANFAWSTDIYVGKTDRMEANPDGSLERPYLLLEDALRHVRELRRLNDPSIAGGVRILIKPGVYRPDQAILLRPEDSGTADSPTRIQAMDGAVVLSGGRQISDWTPIRKHPAIPTSVAKHVYVAEIPKVGGKKVNFRQLWVNNQKAIRAESHGDLELPRILNWNFQKETAVIPNLFKNFTFTEGMEFFIHQWWAVAQLRVKDAVVHRDSIELFFHQPESKIQSEHPWPKPWLSEEYGNSAFRLVNALQFLDHPGEWFLDEDAGKVYYYKREDEDLSTADVVFPYLETIMQIQGTLENPVSHVYVDGISFQHAAWFRPNTHGHVALQAGMYFHEAYKLAVPGTPDKAGLENLAWLGRPRAAVSLANTNQVRFANCSFRHLASTGVDLVQGNDGDQLEGNLFYDIGGNGILIGKFSDESLEAHLPYIPTDAREVSRNVSVRNNVVHNVANEDWGAVGIGAGFVQGVDISQNDISEVSYSGISIGWGWTPTINVMKNNKVERNRISRYGKFMYDVAGIYTLSAQPGTKIRYNEIDSIYTSPYAHIPDHWFYLYTDEGSAYMDVSENWFPEDKILKNANGPAVIWENNGPDVLKDSLLAGLEDPFRQLLTYKNGVTAGLDFNKYVPFTKPVFVQVYDRDGSSFSAQDFKVFASQQGLSEPMVYGWNDYRILVTTDELAKKVSSALLANYPDVEVKMFNDLFYSFDRENCPDEEGTNEVDFVLLSAQLVEDEHKQKEYYDYHHTQAEAWPEVKDGFCQAGFHEVLLYRNGRQLLLYVTFSKGKRFEEIDQLTTKNNPRVGDWNALMQNYQEGIKGTKSNETWIFYKN